MIPAVSIEVPLGSRAYQVAIGDGILATIGQVCQPLHFGKNCAVVTDSNVGPLYATAVVTALEAAGYSPTLITVPAGECSKAMSVAEEVCNQMIAAGLDRKSWLVALGGGVIGDLAGFVAAIYYRGIPFVQVPTTVIAQVDSAVGGKTGVNSALGKNLIGAFHQPRLVLADVATLRSLPRREFNEGFAEIIKHGAIRDRALLDDLSAGPALQTDSPALARIIAKNVQIKATIVGNDEHETTGERALLNFGHTVGHAIENAAGYGKYLHGEAISLGLLAACSVSVARAGMTEADQKLVYDLLARFELPLALPPELTDEMLIGAMQKDKKFSEGAIRFVVCPALGNAYLSKDITLEDIRSAIKLLRAL